MPTFALNSSMKPRDALPGLKPGSVTYQLGDHGQLPVCACSLIHKVGLTNRLGRINKFIYFLVGSATHFFIYPI